MRPAHFLLPALLLSGAAGFSISGSAQVVEGVDLQAVRARAKAYLEDAQQFSDVVAKRGDDYRNEALDLAEGAIENKKTYADEVAAMPSRDEGQTFDFDTMIAEQNAAEKAGFAEAPRFVAFVSTSMPAESLRQIMYDVPKAGGVVVFRGFPGNSAKNLVAALLNVVDRENPLEGVGIDPRLFQAFAVDTVPTYVVASTDFTLCDGFDCSGNTPPHDRMTGNVTAEYALSTFASGTGAGAAIADLHLDRLKGRGE